MWFIILCILLTISLIVHVVMFSRIASIKNQLRLVISGMSHSTVKTIQKTVKKDELVDSINQLILRLYEIETKYNQISLSQRRMISSLSHDFRTPLTSILGYIQLLQDVKDDGVKQHYLSIIEERSKNLTDLIEEFYQLSLLDSNEYQIDLKLVNPKRILQDQLVLYYEDLKNKFHQVVINIDERDVSCQSDMNSLKRIIANIIKNAIIHGEGLFEVDVTENDQILKMAFSNDCINQEPMDVSKLFDRLFTATSKPTVQSTGLGLNIAKSLADRIGAKLSVKYENQRLIFTLELLKNG